MFRGECSALKCNSKYILNPCVTTKRIRGFADTLQIWDVGFRFAFNASQLAQDVKTTLFGCCYNVIMVK